MSRTFSTGTASMRKTYTELKNRHDNNADDDDFASFNKYQEEDNGRELAREFYKELQYRESQPSTTTSFISNLEETAKDSTNNDDDDNATTIRIQANRNSVDSSKSERRRTFTNQPTTSSSPLLDLLAFFSISLPPPRPAQSAGLFSGSGTTVYSSGRSIRAEIEILESTINNSEDNTKGTEWNGIYISSPEQLEEVLRSVLISLIVLSAAYVVVESGGMNVISLDHVVSLMSDVTDGMSSMMVSVGDGEVFMGEEAAWLIKESSELAASVAAEAVKSVEALVLI